MKAKGHRPMSISNSRPNSNSKICNAPPTVSPKVDYIVRGAEKKRLQMAPECCRRRPHEFKFCRLSVGGSMHEDRTQYSAIRRCFIVAFFNVDEAVVRVYRGLKELTTLAILTTPFSRVKRGVDSSLVVRLRTSAAAYRLWLYVRFILHQCACYIFIAPLHVNSSTCLLTYLINVKKTVVL